MNKTPALYSLLLLSLLSCRSNANENPVLEPQDFSKGNLSVAYFASGCFWCVEAVYESVLGVEEAVSGYAGGSEKNPSYKQVGSGQTGHAESVAVYYDSSIVDFKTLIEVYYASQDPTTVNGQSPDFGSQYRSIIFYQNNQEKKIAEDYKKALNHSGKYTNPIATEITRFETFWPAEDYHQDFVKHNPNQGYVKGVSLPRLEEFKAKMPHILK